MPNLSVNSRSFLEANASFQSISFTASLDAVALAPQTYNYYFQDRTASMFSDYDRVSSSFTIAQGQSSANISTFLNGDLFVEGNEQFELVIIGDGQNGALLGGAAALLVTGTILDNDDSLLDPAAGVGAVATQLFGPTSASASLPTIGVRNFGVIEGDNSFRQVTFLVTLDRPATALVSFGYLIQDGTANAMMGDFDRVSSSINIAVGEQAVFVTTFINGDVSIEGDETFQLVLYGASNAVFQGGAPALAATATLIDNDNGAITTTGGIGDFGAQVAAVASASASLPTMSIRDVSVNEGNASFRGVSFLITLDKPATAPVTVSYAFQDGSASGLGGDFDITNSSVTIPVGEQSAIVSTFYNGDVSAESNETFHVILTGVNNAVFAGNAGALVATGRILDNDSATTVSGQGGVGNDAYQLQGPASASGSVPTLSVWNMTVNEGNGSFARVIFPVTLDRPADAPVTFRYVFQDGTASRMGGDFESNTGTITIPVGEQSAFISTLYNGDISLEANESFFLVLTQVTGAVFANNAPALMATGAIVNDDSAVNLVAGVGGQARNVEGPADNSPNPVARVYGGSINEGNSSFAAVAVTIVLSKAAATPITFTYTTAAGTAAAASDFNAASGTATIPAGARSIVVPINVNGDTALEGDETFTVTFSNPNGAVFEGGSPTAVATLTIRDNDGGDGTAGTVPAGPQFNFANIVGGTAADILEGGIGADALSGGAGNDTYVVDVVGDAITDTSGVDTIRTSLNSINLANYSTLENIVYTGTAAFLAIGSEAANQVMTGSGADAIYTGGGDDFVTSESGADGAVLGDGNDTANLGAGADYAYGGAGADTINGDVGADILIGEAGNDVLSGGADFDYLFGLGENDVLSGGGDIDVLIGDVGDDIINGDDGNDFIYSGPGNDIANGGRGGDLFVMEAGNDVVNGDLGDDFVYGGDGADTINGGDGGDILLGEAGDDVITGGRGVDYVFLGTGADTYVIDKDMGSVNVTVLYEFTPGAGDGDVLRLLNTGWTSVAQVQANTFDTGNGYSIIVLDADSQIWVIGLLPSQLTAGDVAFI